MRLFLVLLLALPAAADSSERELINIWKHRMAETESAMKAAEWDRAVKLANKTVDEMAERLGPGQGSTTLFTTALTHKALAHAGAGQRDEAIWYWHMALGLDPAVADLDLSSFGDAAQFLADHRELPGVQSSVSLGATIQPPKLVKQKKPKFPHGAHYFGVAGDLVVEVIVTSDGSVRQPKIVTPLPAATLSYAALEAVKRWRFEPARVNDQPIDMVFNLTVNYKN